jgi:DNA primase
MSEQTDYYYLLMEWKTKYAPKSMDVEPHPCFVEALQNISKVEYQMDTLIEKDIPDRAFVVSDIGKGGRALSEELQSTEAASVVGCGCQLKEAFSY